MILIDTNVVSKLWKPAPDGRVIAWIDAQAIDTLYLSTVTVAEVRFGIAAMRRASDARPCTAAWKATCSRFSKVTS